MTAMNQPTASASNPAVHNASGEALTDFRSYSRTTPGRLQIARAAILFCAFLLWVALQLTLNDMQRTVQTVGKDSVPSIIAAQKIRAHISDMNASAADSLLGDGTDAQSALNEYEKDRKDTDDELITAAQNITYPKERPPIVAMTDGLEIYHGRFEVSRQQVGQPRIATFQDASQQLHTVLMKAAGDLDTANFEALDTAVRESREKNPFILFRLFLIGGLILSILVGTQIFLSRRMRRTLNLPLLGATLVGGFLLINMFSVLVHQGVLLHTAKEDAFDSVHALWRMRAEANDANADESLYLLAPAAHSQYTESFRNKMRVLCNPLPTMDVYSKVAWESSRGAKVSIQGLVADELNNITFPGEREAALQLLQTLTQYVDIDGKIRTLEESGHHAEAVRLCTGNKRGESNWAFKQFDSALDKVLSINQTAFDTAIHDANTSLSLWFIVAPIGCVVIAILGWFGIAPRIREYTG